MTLWCGYVIESQERFVYFAGDTAFGSHFAQIREKFGSPQLALLPIGAYEPRWFMSPVHMAPDEAVHAHEILGAKTSIAIHHGTFQLADEGIDTPAETTPRLRSGGLVSSPQERAVCRHRMIIDKHTVALISIAGSSLDVLGALYLAYDLLGGEHGPLRTLTRGVTYGAVFGAGYGLTLGPVFGLVAGAAHGITLAWEFSRASRGGPRPGFWYDTAMSAIRGCGFALGASYSFGAPFGITFGVLSTAGQAIAYRIGIRPDVDYQPATRPRLTRFQLLAAANRTVGYAVTGYVSSLVAQQPEHALAVGLKAGVAIGVVTAAAGSCTPFIEWTADHLPEKRMGVLGVGLILIGFTLQSIQYWLALLDVSVR